MTCRQQSIPDWATGTPECKIKLSRFSLDRELANTVDYLPAFLDNPVENE